ncbi:thiol-disulfide isomerase/thioredoxin [Cellulophaga sp. RHA_52]|uniref:thioredoxin family protein n=1 Tax=Cellulophaga sp. RHA_52 TaxID=1250036 RepID=UPI00119A7F97|nr:thioredoxin family protein [Cellulophaga sp. RHA_52]TVZ08711.1 thiol-disulfide isomerase/thioredoxin [Cellulophaga sp. RHA_52]
MNSTNTINTTVTSLITNAISAAMPYTEYREQMRNLVANNKSTGVLQTDALANYTMLNDKRMKRLDKTTKLTDATISKIKQVTAKVTWLVLTESWCGDAAQSMPVMQKFAEQSSNINVKVILRDENLELMNHFLYNNTLSIPRLIAFNEDTQEVIGDWGPRPSKLTKIVENFKAKNGSLTPEFKQELQVWYNKDKGNTIIEDLTQLLALK